MNVQCSTVLAIVAVLLSGCANRGVVCEAVPYPIELTPARPVAEGVRLVSISNSSKVTLRFEDGVVATARLGEEFVLRDGSRPPGFYKLRSVDTTSGRVVVEGTMFSMLER